MQCWCGAGDRSVLDFGGIMTGRGTLQASFRQNYQTPLSLTVPLFATRSARVVGNVEGPGSESGNV
jgi:hypothetical protein